MIFLSHMLLSHGCVLDCGLLKRKFETVELFHHMLNRAMFMLVTVNSQTIQLNSAKMIKHI